MAAPKSCINTEFYNKNTIELELKGSNFNGVFIAHRHGHSYRTVFVLDLNDPCLSIRHCHAVLDIIKRRELLGTVFW